MKQNGKPRAAQTLTLCLMIGVLTACDSEIVNHARKAEADGSTINKEMMGAIYPQSFRAGEPPYLERDFEAGADMICDEIERTRGEDLCADPDINWR